MTNSSTLSTGILYHNATEMIMWVCGTFGFEIRLIVPGQDNLIIHAHLTLLRIKGTEELDPLKKMTEIELKTKFTVDEIALYQSRLLAHGSIYKELLNYKLN